MGYIEHANRFWKMNEEERFTQSECILYFYLLNACNRNYWRSPFSVATTIITYATSLSKQTLMRAREGLKQRGLITFTKGVQNSSAPLYSIIENVTACETALGTACETADGTIYNNKNKNYNKIDSSFEKYSLDVLEERMLADIAWQEQVTKQLYVSHLQLPDGKSLSDYIKQFFSYLKICNFREREESQCRSHFYNKLIKEYLKQKNYGNNQSQSFDRRGKVEVPDTATSNYEGPF